MRQSSWARARILAPLDSATSAVLGTILLVGVTVGASALVAASIANSDPPVSRAALDLAVSVAPANHDVVVMLTGAQPVDATDLLASVYVDDALAYRGPIPVGGGEWAPGAPVKLPLSAAAVPGRQIHVAITNTVASAQIASAAVEVPSLAMDGTPLTEFTIDALVDGSDFPAPPAPLAQLRVDAFIEHPSGRKFVRHVYADLSELGGPVWVELFDDGTGGDARPADSVFGVVLRAPANIAYGTGSVKVFAVDLAGARVGETVLFDWPALPPPPPTPPFTITPTGGVYAECSGPVDLDIIATEITYGAGGPPIPVRASYTVNGGSSLVPLNNGDPVARGQQTVLSDVAEGSILGIFGNARYSRFNESYYSYTTDPHVRVLQDGDPVPNVPAFDNQTSISEYLAPYVDFETDTISLTHRQVIMLWEFNPDLSSSAADYQDLVVLLDFGCA